jgi:hypothetical protein
MTTKQEKILTLHEGLMEIVGHEKVFEENPQGTYNVKVSRLRMRLLIIEKLQITDPHMVNNWVNLLLTTVLTPNPHTQESAIKGLIKPTNDTYYFVNMEKLKQILGCE